MLDALELARAQFALTATFHFVFVVLTMGLSVILAVMQTIHLRTGDDAWRRLTRFWGRIFLINVVVGVVTGLVLEFQFGMNWSRFSVVVGSLFGAPLAVEVLTAFFLESVLMAVWWFGWDRVNRRTHTVLIWLIAFGANLSAFWILLANGWMHHPVGYAVEGGRVVAVDLVAVLFNYYAWLLFVHAFLASLVTAAFVVAGISALRIRAGTHTDSFARSLRLALVFALAGSVLLAFSGHEQAQYVERVQPMKMAAMEALWETESPAGFSLFAVIDEDGGRNLAEWEIPYLLSVLADDDVNGEVRDIHDVQAAYEQEYGPGDYVPPVTIVYWSFRLMVGIGLWLIAVSAWGLWLWSRGRLTTAPGFLAAAAVTMPMPYVANTAGWVVTEVGRQPWIVHGLMRTDEAHSPAVTTPMLWITFIGFTALFAALTVIDWTLIMRASRRDPQERHDPGESESAPDPHTDHDEPHAGDVG